MKCPFDENSGDEKMDCKKLFRLYEYTSRVAPNKRSTSLIIKFKYT